MSEYQFYEFEAIDRPLTEEEQQAVSSLSSRVSPHPYRAEFVYHYSDLRADPKELVAKYYDAMFYIANWGTTRLMFRFPKEAINIAAWEPYCVAEGLTLSTHGDYVILDINYSIEEGYGWLEEETYLGRLIPLRQSLLAGDLRPLYLGWLSICNSMYFYDVEDDTEPPVPPGLGQLTPAMRAFIDVFELDSRLVTVAAQKSGQPVAEVSTEEVQQAIANLPRSEVDGLLLALYQQETNVAAKLRQLLRPQFRRAETPASPPEERRSYEELVELAKAEAQRANREAEVKAKAKREAEVKAMADREEAIWDEVMKLLKKTTASNYDQATKLLIDLRDVARLKNKEAVFQARVNNLTDVYSRRSAFLRRLSDAQLI